MPDVKKAIILTVGDEITTGHRKDTNSSWLSRELTSINIKVLKIVSVPDNIYSIVNFFQNTVFFDDFRIHPIDANMISHVYDKKDHRLMADLDENNYAVFYEYDDEGKLIRTKRETEKGIVTMQEKREHVQND